jgi:hypothetical protein
MKGEGSKHQIFQRQLKKFMFRMFSNFKHEVEDERQHAAPRSQERINDALGVERMKGNILTL